MKNEVREMSIRKRKNGFGISSDAGEILFKEFETADWLSKDEENDLLREAKGDGKLGFDEQALKHCFKAKCKRSTTSTIVYACFYTY